MRSHTSILRPFQGINRAPSSAPQSPQNIICFCHQRTPLPGARLSSPRTRLPIATTSINRHSRLPTPSTPPLPAAAMPAIKQELPSSPPHVSPYSLRQRRKPPAPSWLPEQGRGHLSELPQARRAPKRPAATTLAAPFPTVKEEFTILEDPLAPAYSEEDQRTLEEARFTVQEAELTAELVQELGLFPVQKKKHGRKNAARARSVMGRLERMEACALAWGQQGRCLGAELGTAGVVLKEVGMWKQALEGCGWEEWEVSDDEYQRRGRAALEELLGEVRLVKEMLQVGGQGKKGNAEEKVRALAKRYLQVFHLLACGSGLDGTQGVEMEVIRGQMAMLPTGTERTAEDILAQEAAFLCSGIINGPGEVKKEEL
ncbi:uncharacterized protein LAJ45_03705 [Morchella importuna]|uniref:uncharacterized protein n=1 Tax=Morchella importuna TaxID=1174673 RepID=UPI001E8E4806|nr:uncharacterized protein LAJ45_03705 [Morchella importuna]KAH8152278.1 hypothetical protein LAJ45_03705 [Morchella importuna]